MEISEFTNCEYPQYSVLMSVYIKEKPEFLKLALDSMFNQTVPPAEIVLVEDGPLTTELYALLDEYSAKHGEKFKRIANETNLGLGKALNKGLAECANELVARMDTDDISDLARCEKQLQYFAENSELDVIGTDIAEFTDSPDNIVSVRKVPNSHEEICEFLKKRCPLNHMSVMFKKSSVEKAGGYLDWHYNEDYYLWIRMYLAGCKFANIEGNYVYVRVGEEMFARRGGKAYYKSEKELFKFMRKNKIISWGEYQKAKTVRFIVQRLMTNRMRQWFFKKYARKQ